MRLWIAPSFRSRRAVQKDGPHLSVAYDLTCFIRFFGFDKKCSKSLSMRLWIAPSFRSRRAVQKGGLHLSVAYDLTPQVITPRAGVRGRLALDTIPFVSFFSQTLAANKN